MLRFAPIAGVVLVAGMASGLGILGVSVPWINGDFVLGGQLWTAPAATTFRDADGDGDTEAHLLGCGDGTWQISRGITKLPMPGRAHMAFDVEKGQVDYWSFRMIMLKLTDPLPYVDNLFSLDPTGTLQPDWFNDDVLAWEDWATDGPLLAGHHEFVPAEATNGYNIAGWAGMTQAEREQELLTYTHMTLVVYGCASGFDGGATLDNFAWVL